VVLPLLKGLDALDARLHQASSTSSRPPSTAAPLPRCQRRRDAIERRPPGAKPGQPGPPQVRLEPTASVSLFPDACACGQRELRELPLDHTHQVLALPGMHPEVRHWLLEQGRCLAWGTRCQAALPSAPASGSGPRLTASVGELAGRVGASRRAGQDLCASVVGLPLRNGAIQQRGARGSEALGPHDDAMGAGARSSLVHSMDETSWRTHGDRHGLWVRANPLVAYFQSHRHRSKQAFVPLRANGLGIVVSAGESVSPHWQG
jgi:transposase